MIRALLITANLLSVLALRFGLAGSKVSVEASFPDHIKKGDRCHAEITINKNDVVDFGRLEVRLPDGLKVVCDDAYMASFEAVGNIVMWTWKNLPEGEEIKLNVELISDREIESPDPATRLLYLANGEKRVSGEGPFDGASHVSQQQDESHVQVRRELSLSANEIEVSVTIFKDGTSGFARYSDVLPKGMQVENALTDGSSFSVAEGKVRFVWVNVPAKDTLRISYRLKGKGPSKVTLAGEYSYLDNNKSRKKILEPEVVELSPDAAVAYPKRTEVKEKKSTKSSVKKEENLVNARITPPSKGNLGYRVQIGAFRNNKVTVSRLTKKFHLTENISTHMHEGYFKFMTADHAEYKDARDHRERLRNENKIRSAFVVAYNNGQRITVQEALMISKQKWYK